MLHFQVQQENTSMQNQPTVRLYSDMQDAQVADSIDTIQNDLLLIHPLELHEYLSSLSSVVVDHKQKRVAMETWG